jgi:hypothetical protein
VGLGCAIENLVLGARARGLGPRVSLLPDGPSGGRVARIDLAPAEVVTSAVHDAIGHRHSNRGPYTSEALSSDTLAGLVDTTDLPGVGLCWITSRVDVRALGELMVEAATDVTHDEQQSRDSFDWFRASDADVQRHRDGLTLDGQGLWAPLLTMAKLLPATSRRGGDRFWVDQTRDVHTATATTYGVVTVADATDPSTRLIGGRLLQRVHLTATSQGLALQHMNQITERADRAPTALTARFAALLPVGVVPLATFRVGRAVRPGRPSPRRSLEAVLR